VSLNHRIASLEDWLFTQEDSPSLEQRLRDVMAEARERRRLGLPRPEPPADCDSPIGVRLRRAWERAEALRQQFR
jgi:hypothetical protein